MYLAAGDYTEACGDENFEISDIECNLVEAGAVL
jgi:hypothetical protein